MISVTTKIPAFPQAPPCTESVEAYGGGILGSGVVTGGSFSFTVPVGAAPTELYVEVYAQSTALGTFATSDLYLYESGGIAVTVGISRCEVFGRKLQPGQTLTVTWNIAAYGVGTVSPEYDVSLWTANGWFGDSAALSETVTSATSGSFEYTVPLGGARGSRVALRGGRRGRRVRQLLLHLWAGLLPGQSEPLRPQHGTRRGLRAHGGLANPADRDHRGTSSQEPPVCQDMATTGSMSPPQPRPRPHRELEWQGSPPSVSPGPWGMRLRVLPTAPPGAQ